MGNRENNKHPLSKSQQLNPYLATTPFAAVVLLHILGWLFPGNATWGFSFWSVVDPVVSLCVFATVVLLLYPPVTRQAARLLTVFDLCAGVIKKTGKVCVFVLMSGLMLAVLYYFRSRALVYGGGYTVLSDAADSGPITLHFQYKFQILSVYFYKYIFIVLQNLTDLDPQHIYAMVNAVGGVIGMWALVRISGQITSTKTSRVFVLLGALTSASVVLFFGYIENYTWALAWGLWTLSYAIGYTKNQNGVTGLVIFAALALAFHMITLPFVLVALLSLFIQSSPSGNYLFGIRLRRVNTVLAVGSLVFVGLSQLADIDIFVSLLPKAENPYWLLSKAHLIDVFNELVLVAGLGISIFVFDRLRRPKAVQAVGVVDGILGSAAILTLLTTFWIDPGIGAPRDWDLLSFAGFPITLWALFQFTKLFPSRDVPSRWIIPVVAVLIVQLGANLYEKNDAERAVSRLDGLLVNDIHYQSCYHRAQRCVAWAVILQEGADRNDLAIVHLKRRAEAFEESYQACFNLGDIYCRRGDFDSAAKYIERGLYIMPDDIQFLVNLAKVEKFRERYSSSAKWARRAVELEPTNIEALTDLGIALTYCDSAVESLSHFRKAYLLAPHAYNQRLNLGLCHGMLGQVDSAYCHVHNALELAPWDMKVELYAYVIAAAMELEKKDVASEHLNELRKIAPEAPVINDLSLKLAQMEQ